MIASAVPSGPGAPTSSIPAWRISRGCPRCCLTARYAWAMYENRRGTGADAYRVATTRAIGIVMSERSTSTLPCSSNSRYAGSAAAESPRVSTVSYSSAGVATSP